MPFKFETARRQAASIQGLTAADRFRVPDKSRFSSQPLPQNLGLIRSWHVNARSMAESPTPRDSMRFSVLTTSALPRHWQVIHDQARAEELAVQVFLKWWRNPQAHGEQAQGRLYRTSLREALDESRRRTRRSRSRGSRLRQAYRARRCTCPLFGLRTSFFSPCPAVN